MEEAESTQSSDAPDGAPSAPVSDWANVRGFQVLAAAGSDPEASASDSDARTALAKELGVRAARFAQSVDDSIVLASDGLIRWLGDPVARLIAGEELLKPRGVLLADDALAAEDRQAAQTRLDLWISAHITRLLGPLEALADAGAVAEPVRALAHRVSQALGVLERDRVRQQVKTLDQNARSALRKLGVRFGSMYIFVPALLKPGARTLCSQLWGLRRGEAGVERLLAFAAAGRTSFAAEAPLAADTYRVAGFRLCGDRVVRIDIVERLNDLIRAAIPDHMRPGGRSPSEASGFVVSPQMTSLTGCAGESFASILRSLGYESHRVRKSDYEAAMRKPSAQTSAIPAPGVASTAAAEADHADFAAPDAANEGSHDIDDDGDPQAAVSAEGAATEIESAEPPTVAPQPESEPAAPEGTTASADPLDGLEKPAAAQTELLAEPGQGDSAPSLEESREHSIDPADIDTTEAAAKPTPAATAHRSQPSTAEDGSHSGSAEPVSALVARYPGESSIRGESPPTEDVQSTPVDAADELEPPIGETSEIGPDSTPAEDEWIEVWRPAPRRRPEPAPRVVPTAHAGETGADPGGQRQPRDSRRRWGREGVSPEVAARAEPAPNESVAKPTPAANKGPREGHRGEGGAPHRQERGRRQGPKGPRNEEAREPEVARAKDGANATGKREYRPAPVDMDSPFAKLLALKPLLERRDKRT